MSVSHLYDIVGDRFGVARIPGKSDACCSSLCHHRNARSLGQSWQEGNDERKKKKSQVLELHANQGSNYMMRSAQYRNDTMTIISSQQLKAPKNNYELN